MLYFTTAENLSDIFTIGHIFLYLGVSLGNAVLLMLVSYKFLQIMQQSGYEGYGYFKWLRRRDNIYLSRLTILSMMSLLGFFMINIAFSTIAPKNAFVFYSGFVFYIAFTLIYFRLDKKHVKKVPLVYTARMKRLITAYFIVLFIFSFGLISLFNIIAFFLRSNLLIVSLRFSPICLMPVFVPFFVLIAYYIMNPFERRNQKKYIKKCMKSLYERPDLIKIGITGSYGKTSVKEILRTILSEKYEVLSTPSSYNTPMGICKTVKDLNENHEVFIAEMGARHVGDIRELAEIVKPNYAIISGITTQHLETFGSLAAIKQTKFELVESIKDGAVAYTVDNEATVSMFKECNVRCIPAGIDENYNPKVFAKDIKTSAKGSEFILSIGDETSPCHTRLLGKHNISNICLAAAICHELNMTLGEISAGIGRLTPISHRLEVIDNGNGITILDDSYNSNVKGIDAALDVLKEFDGRKIVITPGLVELGIAENIENFKFGKKMAEVCDLVILVGRSASFIMKEGLVDGGFNPDNVIIAKDLAEAKKQLPKLLKAGDVVLFENDLPDKFA